MSTYNCFIILGTLGHDPELKTTKTGKPYCHMSLATNEVGPENAEGEREERTQWHSVHVFGRDAENASRFLKKGHQVLVEGAMDNQSSEENGTRVFRTYNRARRVTFLGRRAFEAVGAADSLPVAAA